VEQVVIIGGGMGGLMLAAELKMRGMEPLVLEASRHAGGVARSIEEHGYRVEPAAGTMLVPHPELSPILEGSSAAVQPVGDQARRRWVYDRSRLIEIEPGPRLVLSPLVGPWGKLRAGMEPLARARSGMEEESLEEFMQRRFGRGVGTLAAHLMACGVHAGNPRRLSVDAFPVLRRLEESSGSVIKGGLSQVKASDRRPKAHVPVGGMGSLADGFAFFLGEAFRPSFEVESVRREGEVWIVDGPEPVTARRLVLAVRPEIVAGLVQDPPSELAVTEPAPVAVVALGGKADELPIPSGFGYLAGPSSGCVGMGCLFESAIDPARAPTGHNLVRVIAGGALNPDVVEWDDETLVQRVGDEVSKALGKSLTVSYTRVVRHSPGIPQRVVGHAAWLAALESALGGVELAGWGYRGIGLSQLATDAVRIADRLEARG